MLMRFLPSSPANPCSAPPDTAEYSNSIAHPPTHTHKKDDEGGQEEGAAKTRQRRRFGLGLQNKHTRRPNLCRQECWKARHSGDCDVQPSRNCRNCWYVGISCRPLCPRDTADTTFRHNGWPAHEYALGRRPDRHSVAAAYVCGVGEEMAKVQRRCRYSNNWNQQEQQTSPKERDHNRISSNDSKEGGGHPDGTPAIAADRDAKHCSQHGHTERD